MAARAGGETVKAPGALVVTTYAACLTACAEGGRHVEALRLLDIMRVEGNAVLDVNAYVEKLFLILFYRRKAYVVDTKVALLRGREANLTRAVDAADARFANVTASLVPGVLDQQVKDEVAASTKVVTGLRQSAKAELRALRKRERGAALKVGQMLSFNDSVVLPPALQQVMERVRDGTDWMPDAQLQRTLS